MLSVRHIKHILKYLILILYINKVILYEYYITLLIYNITIRYIKTY